MKTVTAKRKKAVLFLVLVMCGCSLAACADQQTQQTQQSPAPSTVVKSTYQPTPAVGEYTQSDWLDDYARTQGIVLPPINERLPSIPVVVDIPGSEVGTYTSEEIVIDDGPIYQNGFVRMNHRLTEWYLRDEPLMKYDEQDRLVGNVFQACEIDDQFMTYTFTMREGLRWSDGSLVTTEDVRFTVKDCWAQEKFYPFPRIYYTYDNPWFTEADREGKTWEERWGIPDIKVLDELHFQLIYEESFPKLATLLTQQNPQYMMLLWPSDYLKKFHPFYADNGTLRDIIIDEIVDNKVPPEMTYSDVFVNTWMPVKCEAISTKAPTLGPWMYADENEFGEVLLERNPYYWKVDAAHQQLPYIDRLRLVVEKPDQTPEETADYLIKYGFGHGQFNYMVHIDDFPPNYVNGKQMEMAQNYIDTQSRSLMMIDQTTRSEGACGFRFILDTPDAWWKEMVRDATFRKALCLAVDGERLAKVVGGELATPFDGWEYDPNMAETLLDQVLRYRTTNNYRSWDGGPMVMQIVYHDYEERQLAAAEVYAACFKEVGINCELVKRMPTNGMQEVNTGGHIVVGLMLQEFTGLLTYIDPGYVTGYYEVDALGYRWHATHGNFGREPLEEAKVFFEKMDALLHTHDISIHDVESQLDALMLEGAICYPGITNIPWPMVVDVRFTNMPDKTMSLQEAFRMSAIWFLK